MQKIIKPQTTLVDQVEDQLLLYFKNNGFKCGDHIPNDMTLSAELGVARSVVREALSRLKMIGMIYTRPKTGMVLTEPSILCGMERVIDPQILGENSLIDLLGFRIALEIGIANDVIRNITPNDIILLEEIVKFGQMFENNEYSQMSEYKFHAKLYEIAGNAIILQFQELVHPIMQFVKQKFKTHLEPINIELKKNGLMVTHADLLEFIKNRDETGFKYALEKHFEVYRILIKNKNELN